MESSGFQELLSFNDEEHSSASGTHDAVLLFATHEESQTRMYLNVMNVDASVHGRRCPGIAGSSGEPWRSLPSVASDIQNI